MLSGVVDADIFTLRLASCIRGNQIRFSLLIGEQVLKLSVDLLSLQSLAVVAFVFLPAVCLAACAYICLLSDNFKAEIAKASLAATDAANVTHSR